MSELEIKPHLCARCGGYIRQEMQYHEPDCGFFSEVSSFYDDLPVVELRSMIDRGMPIVQVFSTHNKPRKVKRIEPTWCGPRLIQPLWNAAGFPPGAHGAPIPQVALQLLKSCWFHEDIRTELEALSFIPIPRNANPWGWHKERVLAIFQAYGLTVFENLLEASNAYARGKWQQYNAN